MNNIKEVLNQEFAQLENARDVLQYEIAHEYKPETIYDIFEQVMELAPVLLKSVDSLLVYSKRYFK